MRVFVETTHNEMKIEYVASEEALSAVRYKRVVYFFITWVTIALFSTAYVSLQRPKVLRVIKRQS